MARQTHLFRTHELAIQTQYAELKERVFNHGKLLPGTPGTLVRRDGSGAGYAYRAYYPVPGARQKEDLVCRWDDRERMIEIADQLEFAEWMERQLVNLRKLGFQVTDKKTARVLVELHNTGLFQAGLTLVGTLAYATWLNELGVLAVSARTLDIDLARGKPLKLAAPISFLDTVTATSLPFVPVPGLPSSTPSSSVKLPGAEGLRVDVLVPGKLIGRVVRVAELAWAAQEIPYYDYLLETPSDAVALSGGHCIPVRIPQLGRFILHKLYSAAERNAMREKAEKDLKQATLLLAVAARDDALEIKSAIKDCPKKMREKLSPSVRLVRERLSEHPEALDMLASLN